MKNYICLQIIVFSKRQLFKLQAEEMTKEMQLSDGKKKVIADALSRLKKILLSLPEIDIDNICDTSWISNGIKVPWKWKGFSINGGVKLQKPTSIEIAGSFPLETSSKSERVIHAKDYLNFRYHHKRALYSAYIASHLYGHDIVEDMSYTFSNGDHLRPMLSVILKGKSLKRVTFKLLPCPGDTAFRLERFAPVMSNIRSQWYKNSQDEEEKFPTTPHYNASLLCDMCMEKHLQHILEMSQDFPSFKQSLMVFRVWLHQRELDKGPGSFSAFLAAMLISYLLQEKKLSRRMTTQQIVRSTLHYLAQSDWTEHGIALNPEGVDSSTLPSIDDFHSAYEVVFIDQTGFLNLCAEMKKNTYEQVKFEASCTLGYLSDSSVDSFQLLCMTSVPFSRKYDQVIQ
ncbi:putative nucleolar protein 6-like [Apostichopus japonicus]|uniref:Nucleolar protein 6 n=1 Tax=Stichopus japonicus TaxID=307972 RepID=A0A2G8LMR0_STIJA|nr:putative nucleolar protein 6-like [Apostichopus japonicus]